MLGILRNSLAVICCFAAMIVAIVLVCIASTAHSAITWSGDLVPDDPTTWYYLTKAYIGQSTQAEIIVDSGSSLLSAYGYLGDRSGSVGIVTIKGAGSSWSVFDLIDNGEPEFYIGNLGSGILNIQSGGQVGTNIGYIGFGSGSTGSINVSGTGSTFSVNSLYVGYEGNGRITVTDGGSITNLNLYASLSNLYGNGTINAKGVVLDGDLIFNSTHLLKQALPFGSGGTLNLDMTGPTVGLGDLGAGYQSSGTLTISEGRVVKSTNGYLGYQSGSSGVATVSGTGSQWSCSGPLFVGRLGNATLTVTDGGSVNARAFYGSVNNLQGNGTVTASGAVMDYDFIFDQSHGTQKVLYFGSGGTLTLNLTNDLGCGYREIGTIRIAEGKIVSSLSSYLGYFSGATGTATVTGAGSTWNTTTSLYVGNSGSGILTVEAGGRVSSNQGSCFIGYASDSSGIATVSGTNSKISSGTNLFVGYNGDGRLNVETGGQVSDSSGVLGFNEGSDGTGIISGSTSLWTNNNYLTIGEYGNGYLTINAGGQVKCATGIFGNQLGSSGTTTISGIGSKLTVTSNFSLAYNGEGFLNIGLSTDNGGLLVAGTFTLAGGTSGSGTCNLNNGGTLQAAKISKGSGIANFNWNDGTIHNYSAGTNLTISNSLALKLASTGTHSFNIDQNRTGTIDAVLADATGGGTLNKIGQGTLLLTAANTYSGATTIEEGRFKATGSILNTSGIAVSQTGIFELANTSGSATAATLNINNAGTVLISAGSQTVGAINGTGITQVTGSATLTAQSIVQNTLSIGGTGAGSMSTVPEPTTLVLLLTASLGGLLWWRRKR